VVADRVDDGVGVIDVGLGNSSQRVCAMGSSTHCEWDD